MSDDFDLSVVMPVYHGVDPTHLQRALDSIYAQTLPAAEVVVVEDGPLLPAQTVVLDGFSGREPPLRRVALPENRGAAKANQAGVIAARSPWIAKMDADDVSLPHRFATQVEALREGGYDVLGAAMYEFDGDESNVVGVRRLPTEHADMARYFRFNNAVNHPTVVYRRNLALRVGGYDQPRFMQDYDLFARMLVAGAVMHNLPEPLVLFRADGSMFGRRRKAAMFRCELTLQRNLHRYGLVGGPRMAANLAVRSTFRLLPPRLMRRAYVRLFHAAGPAGAVPASETPPSTTAGSPRP